MDLTGNRMREQLLETPRKAKHVVLSPQSALSGQLGIANCKSILLFLVEFVIPEFSAHV